MKIMEFLKGPQVAKFSEWLTTFVAQPDKVLHFAAGALAFCLLLPLTAVLTVSGSLRTTAILVAVAALGWAKEQWDKRHPEENVVDGWDAYATLLGGLAAALVWSAVALVMHKG